jgi:hypothetical protein
MTINPTVTQVSATDTPALVVADASVPVGRNEDGRTSYEIYNNGSAEVYLGAANVSDATGMPLPAGASRSISVRFTAKIWVVCATGETSDVRVLRVP